MILSVFAYLSLDLVLSCGLSVSDIEKIDMRVSDHSLIVFESSLLHLSQSPPLPHCLTRRLNSAAASIFSNTFVVSQSEHISSTLSSCKNTEELFSMFLFNVLVQCLL